MTWWSIFRPTYDLIFLLKFRAHGSHPVTPRNPDFALVVRNIFDCEDWYRAFQGRLQLSITQRR
jgi:hypothetical protein